MSLASRLNEAEQLLDEAQREVEDLKLVRDNATAYIVQHLEDGEDWKEYDLATLVGAIVGDRDRYKAERAELVAALRGMREAAKQLMAESGGKHATDWMIVNDAMVAMERMLHKVDAK